MDFASGIKAAKWLAVSLVDIALIPVRLSKCALQVAATKWLEYEQKQAWNRHVRGTILDPEFEGKSSYYDPRTHH